MLAQRFCDLFHIEGVDGIDRRMVVAVAAGAGLGGVYDAPLAGMFFAVEILLEWAAHCSEKVRNGRKRTSQPVRLFCGRCRWLVSSPVWWRLLCRR